MNRLTSIIVTSLLCIGVLAVILYASSRSKPPRPTPSAPVEGVHTATVAILKVFSPGVRVVLAGTDADVEGRDEMEIPIGSMVRTDKNGRAQIEYPGGTATRIDHDSSVTLTAFEDEPSRVEVSLEKGRVWSRIKKLLGKESYSTKTSTVVATVRGTSYGHQLLTNGKNKILATKGSVHSDCVNQTQNADVSYGTKVEMDCVEGGTLHGTSLSSQDKDEWFTFNDEQDQALDNQYGIDNYDDGEGGVLGLRTILDESLPGIGFGLIRPPLIHCVGPDGLISQASQTDCDNLKKFWDEHPPASTGSTTSSDDSGSSSSTSASSTPTPTPTPLPDPTISTVTITHCFTESCYHTTTIRVEGTHYNADARFTMTLPDATVWSESTSNNATPPDATLVGGDDITFIQMDLYSIPLSNFPCQPVDVTVYFTTAGDTRTATSSVVDPLYCPTELLDGVVR